MNTTLFNEMFIKRFCLPANSDVQSYEMGDTTVDSCLCGKFNHVSCILRDKGKGKCCFEEN